MKPHCPIDGCVLPCRVHHADDVQIVFTCAKHGERLRIQRAVATPEQIAKLRPPIPKSPFPGYPSREEIQMFLGGGNTKTNILKSYLDKIASRFVAEFAKEKLTGSLTSNIRKIDVFAAFKEWFRGHYYDGMLTMMRVDKHLRKLGYKQDRTNRYYLYTRLA